MFPSCRHLSDEESEGHERRIYDLAKTPLQRLLLSGILLADKEQELREVAAALDPLSLTDQLEALQGALLSLAAPSSASALPNSAAAVLLRFSVTCCLAGSEPAEDAEGKTGPATAFSTVGQEPDLRAAILSWRRSAKDPFEGMWDDILSLVLTHPEWSGTELFQEVERVSAGRVSSPSTWAPCGSGSARSALASWPSWKNPGRRK